MPRSSSSLPSSLPGWICPRNWSHSKKSAGTVRSPGGSGDDPTTALLDQVWTWDITKLATLTTGVFLNLYVIIDLFSRCIVGWMVVLRETTALAQQLVTRSIERAGIAAGQLTLHSDRGAPMTAHTFDAMLTTLGIEASRSRPRVSNDNAFSESGFKTLEYQPDFPGRFSSAEHARSWMREFTRWYNA